MMYRFLSSDLFLLTATVAIFLAGKWLHGRVKVALLHPVLLTFVAMISFLLVADIPYERYRAAPGILDFLLGMSVVS